MDEHGQENDEAYGVLADALAADGAPQVSPWPDNDWTDPGQTADHPPHGHATGHDHAPAAGLSGIEALPRRIRRRVEAMLGAGEQVECVVEGRPGSGTRYLVATTHRVISLGGSRNSAESDSLSLPYHRTEPAALSDTVITLSCNEFGTAVSATIEPREGTTLELSHILDRLASARGT